MTWEIDYIGKEFKENARGPHFFDCYGLIWHIQVNVFGNLKVPNLGLEYEGVEDPFIPCLYEREVRNWSNISLGEEIEGDVVLFNIRGTPKHVGTVISEPNKMIHILEGAQVCVENYVRNLWKPRIEGIYRWEGK